MYCPEPEDFLFVTKYIPVYTHQPESKEQLLERINKIDTILNYEINKMMNTFNKPLFIVRHCGMNNYLAWSLAEKKFVCVYDYKKYRDNFRISPYDSYAQKDIVDNTEYGIIPPSEELINGLWLQLHSSIWENKMRWDKWEEREVKEKGDYVAYQDIYEKGIDLINYGRKHNNDAHCEFANLESRVARFERLNELSAPAEIIEKEIKLIEKSIEEVTALVVPILDEVGNAI